MSRSLSYYFMVYLETSSYLSALTTLNKRLIDLLHNFTLYNCPIWTLNVFFINNGSIFKQKVVTVVVTFQFLSIHLTWHNPNVPFCHQHSPVLLWAYSLSLVRDLSRSFPRQHLCGMSLLTGIQTKTGQQIKLFLSTKDSS